VLELLESVGNARFNEIWEASIAEGWTRPGPKTARAEREKFIRAKYEWKGFVDLPAVQSRIRRWVRDPEASPGHGAGSDTDGGEGDIEDESGDLGGGAGEGGWGEASASTEGAGKSSPEQSSARSARAVAADQK